MAAVADDLHRPQVERQQLGVAVARDEGEPAGRVDVQPVVVVAARERDTPDHALRERVDHRDLVARLDVREDVLRDRVVLHVAGLSAEVDRADPVSGRGEHDLRAARLVGDEDAPVVGVVGDAVGVLAGRRARASRGSCARRSSGVAGRPSRSRRRARGSAPRGRRAHPVRGIDLTTRRFFVSKTITSPPPRCAMYRRWRPGSTLA